MLNSSINRLAKVHPKLSKAVVDLCESLRINNGLQIEVVSGLRTYAEQDALYAQGRTKPGNIVTKAKAGYSNHNFGLACDLCPMVDGKYDWNNNGTFLLIGAQAQYQLLEWGGAWKKFIDKPHVQLHTPMTLAECRQLFKKGGLPAVWEKVK